eukprot:6208751-Pleurochrysis_carterae.AAC.3
MKAPAALGPPRKEFGTPSILCSKLSQALVWLSSQQPFAIACASPCAECIRPGPRLHVQTRICLRPFWHYSSLSWLSPSNFNLAPASP